MNISIEQRLAKLENEVKALKSVYAISGSAIETKLSTDTITTDPNIPDVRIKFTPNSGSGQNVTIYSVYVYELSGEDWNNIPVYLLPQDTGEIIANLPSATPGNTYRIEITASVSGTFSQVSDNVL